LSSWTFASYVQYTIATVRPSMPRSSLICLVARRDERSRAWCVVEE
jgi:hypothetical protein